MRVRTAVLAGSAAAAMIAATAPANAQFDFLGGSSDSVRGFYIEGGGGANWLDDVGIAPGGDVTDPAFDGATGNVDFDTGWAIGGRAGYGFEGGLRVEGEVTHRHNDFDGGSISIPTAELDGSALGIDGDATSTAIMGNVYYDFLNDSAFTPYVGVGIGGAHLSVDGTAAVLDTDGDPLVPPPLGSGVFDETDWTLAAQARAGASYNFTPNVALTADYTYFRAFDPEFGDIETDDWENHTVMAGLRYTFGAPAPVAPPVVTPPAEPAPPPPAQQTFLVFFDFDRSNLTPEANNTLDQVVVAHNQQQVTRIMVDGHTDRSGPASYNQGLSERRAESVRQGLIARGVAPDEIVTRAFGETQNLVPTPDGVREPQNRRVEIIFS